MATVYSAPIDPPGFNPDSWREDDDRYLADLKAVALDREAQRCTATGRKPGKYVGEVIGFPVADGSALYMVWQHSPFSLVHIATMDAYQIPDAHARGLRLSDVKAQVDRAKKWEEREAKRLTSL